MSLAQQLPWPTDPSGHILINQIADRFVLALEEAAYSSSCRSRARSLVRQLESCAAHVLGRPPLTSNDLLSEAGIRLLLDDVKRSRSARNRLFIIPLVVSFLHTGDVHSRTAIPECEWVRRACSSSTKRTPAKAYYQVSLGADDHPMVVQFIKYLDSQNERRQKAAKYQGRKLCRWLCSNVNEFLGHAPNRLDLRLVSRKHLDAYVDHLRRSLGDESVSVVTRIIKRWFGYMCLNGHIPQDPARKLTSKSNRGEASWRIWTPQQVEDFLSAVVRHSSFVLRDLALFSCISTMGLRPSELSGLTIGDVDTHGAQLRVHGKWNRDRVLPFHGTALLHMERYLESRKERSEEDAPLWLNAAGRPLTYDSVRRLFHRYRTLAGLESKVGGPHVFRHFVITEFLNSDADMGDVAAFVGHTNLRSLQAYFHTTDDGLRAALFNALGVNMVQ